MIELPIVLYLVSFHNEIMVSVNFNKVINNRQGTYTELLLNNA